MAATSTAVATRPAAPPATPAGRPVAPAVEPQVQKWGSIPLGAALAGVAQAMLLGGLIASLYLTRTEGGAWPPKGVTLDNYRGTTLLFTLLLASASVQWA